ncbi:UvrD-helicase domain-containing protein [Planococcus sp. SIMBA_160]
MNSHSEVSRISKKILPLGCEFFPQQNEVIEAEGSIDIIAGPGSGKTTVLIAKYELLLARNVEDNKGICLITHTNVAVDEIKKGLVKLGRGDIDYPNFLGTIQEFFNTFFARKAFHLLLGDKKLKILDDEEYQEVFVKVFKYYNTNWSYPNYPKFSNLNPELCITTNRSYSISSNAKSSYRKSFKKSAEKIFSDGTITNKQSLELANWYINLYGESLQKALENRFEYVLLDEAQDTSLLQYEMLEFLFSNEEISFQKFGDPYQALYNIFEGNIDAWNPSKEGANYKEISETSRFGNTISNVVKNVCLEKYDNFKSLNIVNSFPPVYMTYEDEADLLKSYKKLISYYEKKSSSFEKSLKKDAILSAFHSDLINTFSIYTKSSTIKRNQQSPLKSIMNFIYDLFSKETNLTYLEIKEVMDSNLELKVIISKIIKEISNKNPLETAFYLMLEALQIVTNNPEVEFEKIDVKNQIEYFAQKYFSSKENEIPKESSDSEFYIGTIHSAKGETHRSTLLLLNTTFKNFNVSPTSEYHMFNLLSDYFIGNYINPKTIENKIERDETIKALKLAYVALSRPTHLMIIAVPNHLSGAESEELSRLKENGWKSFNDIINE